jgi:transposase-like protein
MTECPKCGLVKTVKNGCHLGRQRHRCKDCGFQFTRATPKGRPASEKATAVLLYTLGLSLNSIARTLKNFDTGRSALGETFRGKDL